MIQPLFQLTFSQLVPPELGQIVTRVLVVTAVLRAWWIVDTKSLNAPV